MNQHPCVTQMVIYYLNVPIKGLTISPPNEYQLSGCSIVITDKKWINHIPISSSSWGDAGGRAARGGPIATTSTSWGAGPGAGASSTAFQT